MRAHADARPDAYNPGMHDRDDERRDAGLRRALPGFRWQGVDRLAYKQDGEAPFRHVSRQVLFDEPSLGCQWRYFEMAADGHTTLERHEHVHAVMILRGAGQCLLGDRVLDVAAHDLVEVPPMTWHQFRADGRGPMGFLCLVRQDRDRPRLPTADDLRELRRHAAVASFLDATHG